MLTTTKRLAILGLNMIMFMFNQDTAHAKPDFKTDILPVLQDLCLDCHEPGDSKGDIEFLDAEEATDIRKRRSTWRSVAAQLRNHTMPPAKADQPTGQERDQVASWIRSYLDQTAPLEGPYAPPVTARRLNRLEYGNTVRDLIGLDLDFGEKLPADSGSGEGFNNNGESLYLQPLLLERYLEAAQTIVDSAIISPRQSHSFDKRTNTFPVYVESTYRITVRSKDAKQDNPTQPIQLRIDGLPVHEFKFTREKQERYVDTTLARGTHSLVLRGGKAERLTVRQHDLKPDRAALTRHEQITGLALGKSPDQPRNHSRQRVATFMKQAFRRPVAETEIDRYMKLYDRSVRRGDPWEESLKLALRGVLVTPDFLFRLEAPPSDTKTKEPVSLSNHELAVRLSYFLHASPPDAELTRVADQGHLLNSDTLNQQIERLLNHERSFAFSRDFVGQWLGTKDVGGRIAPPYKNLNENYRAEVAMDMRSEPVHLFHYILRENRPVMELVNANYSVLTKRLADFYQLNSIPKSMEPKEAYGEFQKIIFKEQQRGGLLGTGAVLARTSNFKHISPVLRGAWVFDTLIGDPVPPPPADIPELPKGKKDGKRLLTSRELLALHRDRPACASCHNVIAPIGFALHNYDHLGLWRDQEKKQDIDTSANFPGGKTFKGPNELKRILVETRRDDIHRNVIRKLLSYALGRTLHDRDDATISAITKKLEAKNFPLRDLVKEIIHSAPFQKTSNQSRVNP